MDHATPDTKPEVPRPARWYSGWRLLATACAAVIASQLIGVFGTAIALLAFFWLRPKRGTGWAAAVAMAAGAVVAVAYSAAVLAAFHG